MLTAGDFATLLRVYFPEELPIGKALSIILLLATLSPLWQFHAHQTIQTHQRHETAWFKAIKQLIRKADQVDESDLEEEEHDTTFLMNHVDNLAEWLRLPNDLIQLTPERQHLLCTPHLQCTRCQPEPGAVHSLRLHQTPKHVTFIFPSSTIFSQAKAYLVVAHCKQCKADYYPDRITWPTGVKGKRQQQFLCDAKYLCISRLNVWIDRRVAFMQERSIFRMKCGWKNFASWFNDQQPSISITAHQSQRLFVEHFARRLLLAHNLDDSFHCRHMSDTEGIVKSILEKVGNNGGVVPRSFEHTCQDCTHEKRYREDLEREGFAFSQHAHLMPEDNMNLELPPIDPEGMDANPLGQLQPPPQQIAPVDQAEKLYVRAAVMDGKNIGHKICAIKDCTQGLHNYKTSRFCQDHLNFSQVCGIASCNRQTSDGVTCDLASHQVWYQQWLSRFSRISFPGVQRVIRRTATQNASPALIQLPPLEGVSGEEVQHTFRAQRVYCVETIQWSCGLPIAWGKCYRSESESQVLQFLNKTFSNTNPPDFIIYDKACKLLRHIVTQNQHQQWLRHTRFIVDAWHYIGHHTSNLFCRVWCNPAPANGSQPDLIISKEDTFGNNHTTRAFNSETAEQFNSWFVHHSTLILGSKHARYIQF